MVQHLRRHFHKPESSLLKFGVPVPPPSPGPAGLVGYPPPQVMPLCKSALSFSDVLKVSLRVSVLRVGTMLYSSENFQQPAFCQNTDCDTHETKLCPEVSICCLSGTVLCAGDSTMTEPMNKQSLEKNHKTLLYVLHFLT